MSYLYETHVHTVFSSACANSKGSEYIRLYKELGYSGIVITDHFYRGNTSVPRGLPWKEWVKQFCKGYEEARNEGEKQSFDVFFGWEETFDGCDDYLVYGLDREWLLNHPEARNWTRAQQFAAVTAANGCVIQAHPFRQHSYIPKVVLSTGCVDAVEAANATNSAQSYDALAMRYAQGLGLPYTAGSDTHDARQVTVDGVFGSYVKKKITSIYDLANEIRTNNLAGIRISEGRCDYFGDERVELPVVVRDKYDRVINKNWKDIM